MTMWNDQPHFTYKDDFYWKAGYGFRDSNGWHWIPYPTSISQKRVSSIYINSKGTTRLTACVGSNNRLYACYMILAADAFSDNIPARVKRGAIGLYEFEFSNHGSYIWSPEHNIQLVALNADALEFGPAVTEMTAGSSAGFWQHYTFSFAGSAPWTVKTYYPEWGLRWKGQMQFGETFSKKIVVEKLK
jgi:hypothetical protein